MVVDVRERERIQRQHDPAKSSGEDEQGHSRKRTEHGSGGRDHGCQHAYGDQNGTAIDAVGESAHGQLRQHCRKDADAHEGGSVGGTQPAQLCIDRAHRK